ncbi:MAG: hypothetical protein AAGJ81_12270 [Verrucomicrobiota bacterium]
MSLRDKAVTMPDWGKNEGDLLLRLTEQNFAAKQREKAFAVNLRPAVPVTRCGFSRYLIAIAGFGISLGLRDSFTTS